MMAPGPPMSPHMCPAGSGGPDSYPFAAPWSGRPGDGAGEWPSLARLDTRQLPAILQPPICVALGNSGFSQKHRLLHDKGNCLARTHLVHR